jgi:hypothetical protein
MGADGRKIPKLRQFGTGTCDDQTSRHAAKQGGTQRRCRATLSATVETAAVQKFRALEFEGFAMSEPTIDIIIDLASGVRALNG